MQATKSSSSVVAGLKRRGRGQAMLSFGMGCVGSVVRSKQGTKRMQASFLVPQKCLFKRQHANWLDVNILVVPN